MPRKRIGEVDCISMHFNIGNRCNWVVRVTTRQIYSREKSSGYPLGWVSPGGEEKKSPPCHCRELNPCLNGRRLHDTLTDLPIIWLKIFEKYGAQIWVGLI